MKTLLRFSLLFLGLLSGRALAAEPAMARAPLTPAQIEELVSPIALYPDPLVALILPASTFPADVVLAARFLERGGNPDKAGIEPWDDSVRALARYREVIDYLDDHLEWTRRLGQCFLDQPDDVMDAVQMVRIRARSAGLLQDTPEQHILIESDEICIVPAQPTIIYVPRYDPAFLCGPVFPTYHRGPFISFGIGWRVGSWLNFDCDWRARSVRVVHRPDQWYHRPDWDSRYRDQNFRHTPWVRRAPRHDDRFDRSPRVAGYDPRGADHRNWSSPDRRENRDRDDNRRDHNRRSPSDDNDRRSRDWNNNRRREMPPSPQSSLAPDVSPIGAAVIPPVALPDPTVQTSSPRSRRPEPDEQSVNERFNRPSGRDRGDRNESYRNRTEPPQRPAPSPRPERVSAPETVNRQPPPPIQRVERQDRSDDRGRGGSQNDRSPSRAGGSRSVDQDNQQR